MDSPVLNPSFNFVPPPPSLQFCTPSEEVWSVALPLVLCASFLREGVIKIKINFLGDMTSGVGGGRRVDPFLLKKVDFFSSEWCKFTVEGAHKWGLGTP